MNVETSAEFKARRQLERRLNHWAHVCETHGVDYSIRGNEFSVRDCWPLTWYAAEEGPWQVITSTRDLWKAIGY